MADLRALRQIAGLHDVVLVEDAAQAHGASRDGIRAGTAGRASAFSFYPGKNLGAMGDAGALTTADGAMADEVRARREHGQRAKYRHDLQGYTARLDTVQALVLLHKLRLLNEWNDSRREIAGLYDVLLDGLGDLSLPPVPAGSEPVWHLYVVRTPSADALARFLAERGIGTGRHYPEPPHLSEAYAALGYRQGQFPVAEQLAREGISLPIFPGMTREQVEAVAAGVAEFFNG
jgi:dTDP-4-amino-4,6-dideoxygalactose transaminase